MPKLNIVKLNESEFVIFLPESNDFQDIEIINSIGQKIRTFSTEPNQKSTEINLFNSSSGIYFIILKNKNGQIHVGKLLR